MQHAPRINDVERSHLDGIEIKHANALAVPMDSRWSVTLQSLTSRLHAVGIQVHGQEALAPESQCRERKKSRTATNIQKRASLDRLTAHQANQRLLCFLDPSLINLLGVLRPVFPERKVAFDLKQIFGHDLVRPWLQSLRFAGWDLGGCRGHQPSASAKRLTLLSTYHNSTTSPALSTVEVIITAKAAPSSPYLGTRIMLASAAAPTAVASTGICRAKHRADVTAEAISPDTYVIAPPTIMAISTSVCSAYSGRYSKVSSMCPKNTATPIPPKPSTAAIPSNFSSRELNPATSPAP